MEKLKDTLKKMRETYLKDPEYAVRSKKMIGMLENYIKKTLEENLSELGKKELKIDEEVNIFQDEKEKNIDVVLIHPTNGPIITIGVRSQMSSVAKNTLTYLQEIKGECLGLQTRFPMSTHCYIYMLPKNIIHPDSQKSKEKIDHEKYAKIMNSMGGRAQLNSFDYKSLIFHKQAFDYFCFFVVDFDDENITYEDNWSIKGYNHLSTLKELLVGTIQTTKDRLSFKKYFKEEFSNI